ncbi:MAG: hypothetical protein IPK12_10375 [Gemmatimonadetes bacterium]|nr:hypothetical protein [Gemmatimonadota bacterium]
MAGPDPAALAATVLAQLDDPGLGTLRVGTARVPVTNLERPLWPAAPRRNAVTKRDLLRYYAAVSPWLLPHLRDRPVFVSRFPQGITGETFFQKHWEQRPGFTRTVTIYSSHNHRDADYLVCDRLATLLWLGQMASLELHPWFSRIRPGPDTRGYGRTFHGSEAALERSVLNYPDFVVFDLDPYIYAGTEAAGEEPVRNRTAFRRTRELAFELREVLTGLGLRAFPKLSGRTGIHVYLPVRRNLTYDMARDVARQVGEHFVRRAPKRVTMAWATRDRRGMIFFDANQNSRGKSLAAALSPRRDPRATVAMPLTWERLAAADPTEFTLATVPALLAREGDPWAGMLDTAQDLPSILGPAAHSGSAGAGPPRRARTASKPPATKRHRAGGAAPLETYRDKRDFDATPEPRGKRKATGKKRARSARFVVQKHEASHLHYDFRLEIGGVLKSWAVPKGPSLDPGVKRLAMPTEDHPLEYGSFEGVIPQGQYGGGTVMVWDSGTFTMDDGSDAEAAHRRGRLDFTLDGKKLRGRFHLVRTGRGAERWLLIKSRDEAASRADVLRRDRSATTGRTMAAIRQAG